MTTKYLLIFRKNCILLRFEPELSVFGIDPSSSCDKNGIQSKIIFGKLWIPWSRGYGRRLMFERSWVPGTVCWMDMTFFTLICCKNYNDFSLKRQDINKKVDGVGLFLKKTFQFPLFLSFFLSFLSLAFSVYLGEFSTG